MPACSAPVHTRIGDRSRFSPRIKRRVCRYIATINGCTSRPGRIASSSIAEIKSRNSPTTPQVGLAQGLDIDVHFQQASLFDRGLYLFQRARTGGSSASVRSRASCSEVPESDHPGVFSFQTAPILWRAPDNYYLVAVILWDALVDAFHRDVERFSN